MGPEPVMPSPQPAEHHAKAFSCVVSGGVEVSPLDTREYRHLKLSNEIQVLIVSDSLSDKAAAAMNVQVGHFSDPRQLPGLAHFTEHMCFLGTEKFPVEGSYKDFLARNSGRSNAYTSSENTNYQFELCVPKDDIIDDQNHIPRFKEALDRFSQFFISPLFTKSATDRELNAVDSEHRKNLQLDGRRSYYVKKILSNPEHPFKKFSTGNVDTLRNDAEAAGFDTRKELLEFHSKFYSANIMQLCVCGPHSIDVMQQWVVELFSPIKNLRIPHPSDEYKDIPIKLQEHKAVIAHVDPIKDTRTLEVSWNIPPTRLSYKSKPAAYIARLLGQRGEGSLLSYLKKNKWANSVQSSTWNVSQFNSILYVFVSLTEEGVNQVDEILKSIFAYIRLIKNKGVEKWIFDEASQLTKMGFHFRERGSHFMFVRNLSAVLSEYSPEHALSGPALYREYKPNEIHDILDLLTPNECNVYVVAKDKKGMCNLKEKWYGTSYYIDKISDEKLQAWAQVQPYPEFSIPPKNRFIPQSLDLVTEPMPNGKRDEEGPALLEKNNSYELHFKMDRNFNRPKAHVHLSLKTGIAYASPRHAMLTKIFISLVHDDLTELSYQAGVAGLSYNVSENSEGLRIFVAGYNDKLKELLNAVLDRLANFTVNEDAFHRIIDMKKRMFANYEKRQPYHIGSYNLRYLLDVPQWHFREYLNIIDEGVITVDEVKQFVPHLLSRMYTVAFCGGNITQEWAKSLVTNVVDTLKLKALPASEIPESRVLQVPQGIDFITRMKHPNPDDKNSSVELLFQLDKSGSPKFDVLVDLLRTIIKKPAFHELRTKQQLGYIVQSGVKMYNDVMFLSIAVQSTVAGPDELRKRILLFLKQFRCEVLGKMTDVQFDEYIQSIKQKLGEPDKSLASAMNRFWNEIKLQTFDYNAAQKEMKAIGDVTIQDLMNLFDGRVAERGRDRRCITAMVHGNQHPLLLEREDYPGCGSTIEITDPVAFRNLCSMYPVSGSCTKQLAEVQSFWF